jgi:hypothetical protein
VGKERNTFFIAEGGGESKFSLEPKRQGAATTAGLPSALSPMLRHFLRSCFPAQRAAPEISLFPLRSSIHCATAVLAVAFTRSAARYPIVQPELPGCATSRRSGIRQTAAVRRAPFFCNAPPPAGRPEAGQKPAEPNQLRLLKEQILNCDHHHMSRVDPYLVSTPFTPSLSLGFCR